MNQPNVSKSSRDAVGIASGLYMALSYLAGIIIFIVVLRYPEITDELEKVRIVVEMRSMVFITNLFMYVIFGPVLILFILFLKSSLRDEGGLLVSFSSIIGIVWAGSLTASGMIANAAIEPVSELFSTDPDRAVYLWRMIDTVSLGMGNGNGEVLGGLMTFGFGIAMLKSRLFPSWLGLLGVVVGAVGLVSLVPRLTELAAVFGILQLVWFVFTAFAAAGKKGHGN